MSAALLAAALAAAPVRAQDAAALGRLKTYGVLILAYDVDVKWRQELANLSRQLKGHPVETVDSAADAISRLYDATHIRIGSRRTFFRREPHAKFNRFRVDSRCRRDDRGRV